VILGLVPDSTPRPKFAFVAIGPWIPRLPLESTYATSQHPLAVSVTLGLVPGRIESPVGPVKWPYSEIPPVLAYQEPSNPDQDGPTIETVFPPTGSQDATIETDSAGNVTFYTDLANDTTVSMYNDNGGNDLDELCWKWTVPPGMTAPANPTCGSPPAGSTTYSYDQFGNKLSETDPLSHTTRDGYYANGLLCWTAPPTITAAGSACANDGTSPTGAPSGATTYTYDAQGDVASTTVPAAPSPSKTTTTQYNLDDQVTLSIPPDGQSGPQNISNPYATVYNYEPDGALLSSTAPTGLSTSYTHDAAGNVLTSTDPAGVTTNTYDQDNRLCWSYRGAAAYGSSTTNICTSPPSTGATEYYSAGGGYNGNTDAPKAVMDPQGQVTSYTYGDDRFPTLATTTTEPPVSGTSIVTYDSYNDYANECMSGPDPTGAPGTCDQLSGDTYDNYDAEGQLNNSYDASGNETTYGYADADFPTYPTSMTTAYGQPSAATTGYAYDANGNLLQTEDPAGSYVETAYDADGRPCAKVTTSAAITCGPPTGIAGTTLYGYDEAGQRTSMIDNYGVSGQVTDTYSYDANGNLVSATNDNGQTTGYSYDDANDVLCTSYPTITGSSCTPGSPSGTGSYIVRHYNSAGQLDRTTDWLGNVVGYGAYNPLSEVGTITYPTATGETVGYTYGHDGNVTGIAYSGTAIPALNGASDSYNPNADDHVASSSFSSPLGSYGSSSDTYDTYGRLHQATNPSSSGIGSMSGPDVYTYNPNGEIATDTPSGGSTITDSYNASDELTTSTKTSVDTSYGYTGDGQRCLSVTGSSTYTPTCGVVPPGSAVLGAYNYNAYGQLCGSSSTTASTSLCSSSPPSGTTTYSYDGNNLRMKSTTGSNSSTFDWDTVNGGPTPLDISDGTNSYVYGPLLFGGTAPIEQISSAGVSFLASTPSGVQAVFGSTAKTSATSSADKFTYGSPTSNISAVGSLVSNHGTGLTTLSVTPATVGDAWVLAVKVGSTVTVSSVTGGGATWTKLTNSVDSSQSRDVEEWLGTITSTARSTITVTYSGSVSGVDTELDAQEYTNGTGSSTTWANDVVGASQNDTSSTTVTFPTLTPTGSSELYVGFARIPNPPSAGPTTGFTYDTSTNGNGYIYNPSVSAAVSPTQSQSPAGQSLAVGALITASGTSGSGTAPTVTSVTPASGATSGGASVNIVGTNFTGVTAVKFGSTAATSYTVVNSTLITAVAPAHLTGAVDVTVSTSTMGLQELAAYSAYGVQTIQAGADVTPFGFQGSYTDPSGLIYLIDRYYDPTTDQFLSVDPDVAETGQPYAFTGDDPLNATDPLGLCVKGFGFVCKVIHKSAHVADKVRHGAAHVADNTRHFVAVHRRGLGQIAIAAAAVAATAATAGTAAPLLASVAVGVTASTASYAAGCVGRSGDGGCTARGAIIAAGVGAVGSGLAAGVNSLVGGTIALSLAGRVAQYTSVGILSSAIAGGTGVLADNEWEQTPVTWGGIFGAGLGSLGGIADNG
jgi:RHS repeat-associated protein